MGRQEVHRRGVAGITHVDDADAATEDMADEGVTLVDHALDPVGAAGLVGAADELDVFGRVEKLAHGSSRHYGAFGF